MLELEAALPAPSLSQPPSRREGGTCRISVGPSLPPTNNGKSEEQVHFAASRSVLAWQVQPRCRCLQTQPGPRPSLGEGGSRSPLLYLALLAGGVFAPESKEPLIVEELCSETLISCKSGLHTLSGEHFTF